MLQIFVENAELRGTFKLNLCEKTDFHIQPMFQVCFRCLRNKYPRKITQAIFGA